MSGKNDIREKAKALWLRGMKAVGNTAANIANNTRYKVDEVTLQNRRRETLGDLADKTYALWLKGERFPEPMEKMLDELKRIDEQLNDMRAEKYAASRKTPAAAEETDATEEEDNDDAEASVPESSVSAEINDLFDEVSSVENSAEKVNQSLEQLSSRVKKF